MDDPIDPTARVERAAELIKLTRPGEIGKTDETEETAKSLESAKTLRVEKSDGAEERNAFKEEGASDRALASCGLLSIVVAIVVSIVVAGVAGFYLWRTVETEASEAASNVARLNNLKLIGTAIQKYSETNGWTLPPAILFDAEDGRALHSWRVLILPYLGEEEKALYEQIRLDEPWDSEWNARFHNRMPEVFESSSAEGGADETSTATGATTYAVVSPVEWSELEGLAKKTIKPAALVEKYGLDCCRAPFVQWPWTTGRLPWTTGCPLARITDGTSSTLAVVERKTPVCWMDPRSEIPMTSLADEIGRARAKIVDGERIEGAFYLLLDGTVGFLPASTDQETLQALATCCGGERARRDPETGRWRIMTVEEWKELKTTSAKSGKDEALK